MTAPAHYSQSPFLEFLGTSLEEWRDGYVRVTIDLKPFHFNRAGLIHGGALAALLDHACGFSGLYSDDPLNRRNGLTLSLTTNYTGQCRAGKVIVTGEKVSGGRNIFFAKADVRTEDGTHLASAVGTYRYRSDSRGRGDD